jgi:hypothetical protein
MSFKNSVCCALVASVTAFAGSAMGNPPSQTKTIPEASQEAAYAEDFGELHYAMAEAVGADADAAFEDAFVFAEAHTLKEALSATDVCPETGWAEQVAGGWVGVCGTQDGEFLGYAGQFGVILATK